MDILEHLVHEAEKVVFQTSFRSFDLETGGAPVHMACCLGTMEDMGS